MTARMVSCVVGASWRLVAWYFLCAGVVNGDTGVRLVEVKRMLGQESV